MTEKELQDKCVGYLRDKGIYHFNLHQAGWTGKGHPDIIACVEGKFVGFELKVGDNKLSPAQTIRKRQIKKSGGLHFVPRTFDEFKDIICDLTPQNDL